MKKLIIVTALVILLLPSIAVIAADVSQAEYVTEIVVTNAAVTQKTNITTTVNLTTSDLIDSGMLNDDADDAALLATGAVDAPFMPGYDTNPWLFFVDSIPLLTNENYYLYTGGASGGEIRYFPDTAGMTTSDHASLELGDNFTITLSDVWIDTTAGASKYILYKTDAIELYVDASTSGKIGLTIPEQNYTTNLKPNAAGDYCNISGELGSACPNHYLNVDDTPGASDDDSSYVYDSTSGMVWDAYNIEDFTLPTGQSIDYVRAFIRSRSTHSTYQSYSQSGFRLGTTETFGTKRTNALSLQWTNWTETITKPGGGDWSEADVDSLQLLAGSEEYVTGYSRITQTYAIVYHSLPEVTVSLTGITSGEYDITITADGTDLELTVGTSTNSTALNSVIVTDNANDIISFENDTVLYAGSQEIEIDGVQKQFVEWQYGTTFTDQSGNDNDATPTFRTTGSDGDVTAFVYSQSSTAEQGLPDVEETGGFVMIGDVPTTPSGLFTSGGTTFPGSAQIQDLATATRISYAAWCYVFAFLSAILGGLGIFGLTHRVRKGIRGSMLLMIITMTVILCVWIFGGGGVISGFVLIPFVLIMIFLLMLRNPQSPVVG